MERSSNTRFGESLRAFRFCYFLLARQSNGPSGKLGGLTCFIRQPAVTTNTLGGFCVLTTTSSCGRIADAAVVIEGGRSRQLNLDAFLNPAANGKARVQGITEVVAGAERPEPRQHLKPMKDSEIELRDYFAAQAIRMFSLNDAEVAKPRHDIAARFCYDLADAMLAEREKSKHGKETL